jgi:hypothetical protein
VSLEVGDEVGQRHSVLVLPSSETSLRLLHVEPQASGMLRLI